MIVVTIGGYPTTAVLERCKMNLSIHSPIRSYSVDTSTNVSVEGFVGPDDNDWARTAPTEGRQNWRPTFACAQGGPRAKRQTISFCHPMTTRRPRIKDSSQPANQSKVRGNINVRGCSSYWTTGASWTRQRFKRVRCTGEPGPLSVATHGTSPKNALYMTTNLDVEYLVDSTYVATMRLASGEIFVARSTNRDRSTCFRQHNVVDPISRNHSTCHTEKPLVNPMFEKNEQQKKCREDVARLDRAPMLQR